MDPQRLVWEKYATAWKEPTAERKLIALRESVGADAIYRDPLAEAQGHDALVAYMLDFHRQIPGGHFVTTHFQTHHQRSIAKWNMVDGSGRVLGDGVSYGEYDERGMLVTMTGFFSTPNDA